MRRESEFKEFLIKFRKGHKHSPANAERYVKICHRIEGYMGGRDMDELVVSQEEVEATEKALETKGSFTDTRAALHAYHEFFSASTKGWIAVPASPTKAEPFKTYSDSTGLVVYENSVTSYDRKKTHGLCAFLENEYDKIRIFARDVLQNIWQDFPAIPVYLSKERPEEVFQHDRSLLMKKIRKICKDCDRNYCAPDCPACNRILEEMYFTQVIGGRYYGSVEPHIVLFFKNFPEPWDVSDSKFATAIAKTLAHEYLHFLHDYYVQTVAKTTIDPFADKRLSEALADFFGVLYALKQGYTVTAEDRYVLWKLREGIGWSYSYALKFFEHPYKSNLTNYSAAEINAATQKFRDVFENTTVPKSAKKILGI